MILVSGFNVYPNEIEEVIASHPGVLECAVIGVPDAQVRRGGEGLRRQEGPDPHRRGRHQVLRARSSPATRCRSRSSSGPTCRRPMSARSCAASCATRRRPAALGSRTRHASAMTDARDVTPADILAFWREAGRDRWYRRDDAFDAEVRRRFLDLWQQAAAGELSSWEESDDGALALVIVLDQFPRNMFRGDASDLCERRAGARRRRPRHRPRRRSRGSIRCCCEFLYLPFMHSEHLPDQLRCVALFRSGRQCREPEIRRAACRHHPPVRPLPAPQPPAGPRDDAGGAGLSRRWRVLPADDRTVNGGAVAVSVAANIVPAGRPV